MFAQPLRRSLLPFLAVLFHIVVLRTPALCPCFLSGCFPFSFLFFSFHFVHKLNVPWNVLVVVAITVHSCSGSFTHYANVCLWIRAQGRHIWCLAPISLSPFVVGLHSFGQLREGLMNVWVKQFCHWVQCTGNDWGQSDVIWQNFITSSVDCIGVRAQVQKCNAVVISMWRFTPTSPQQHVVIYLCTDVLNFINQV